MIADALSGWALLLALARVAPVVLVAPAAAGLPLPRVAQAALAVAIAAVVAAGLGPAAAGLADAGWPARALLLGREVLIGAVLGAVAAVPLAAASAAGAWAAADAGDDPGTSSWSLFFPLAAATVFFAVGGHLAVIHALGVSYRALPAGAGGPASAAALDVVIAAGALLIAAGLALAAPLVVAGLVAALLVGLIERMAGLPSELIPEVAVRRTAVALAAAAAIFAIGLAVAGQARVLPDALAAALARLH